MTELNPIEGKQEMRKYCLFATFAAFANMAPALQKAEVEKWWPVLKAANVKAQ